jgi:hypothetical protein
MSPFSMQVEIPKWEADNVEDMVRICLRSKRINKLTVTKYLGAMDDTLRAHGMEK